MAKNLVIVESPSKVKTLKKFLGSAYKIEASVGHVRDLPKSEMGINIENDYEPRYITIRGKGEVLQKLRKEVKSAEKIYLATDPDREGEAISWHLMHALKLNEKNTMRITFNEVTKNTVKKAIKEARGIDMHLVDAQQARRVLDRIVGYKLSPLLWKKVKKGLSAGRVQSVVLKLICSREAEIENFTPEEYWTLDVLLQSGTTRFEAHYLSADNYKRELKNKADVDAVIAGIKDAVFAVSEAKHGTRVKKPAAPFTTSTLQQEASKLLNFAAFKTMMLAQQLYEGVEIKGEGTVGLVSYIRTDSVRLSDEAFAEGTAFIKNQYGEAYANPEKPQYKSRGRSQDAHEAIRPTVAGRSPESVKDSLTKDQYRLYKLIWERFISSLMTPAVYDTLTVKITAAAGTPAETVFRAGGAVLKFDGYLTVYRKNEDDDKDVRIPPLTAGDTVTVISYSPEQHFTQAPPRYSEANLVKTMEESGIGRPSTYASTITNIVQRGYVTKENKVFYPTELGEVVNQIMANNFQDVVDIDFTASMEENLDRVEEGEVHWKEIIRDFYPSLDAKVKEAEEKISHVEVRDEVTDIPCALCGRMMVKKMGRYGRFLACPGFPDCRHTKPLYEESGALCPSCGGKVLIKKTKKGRRYYGCEKHPACVFMSWNEPTGEHCPDCGAYLIYKGTKNRKIVCTHQGCAYTREVD